MSQPPPHIHLIYDDCQGVMGWHALFVAEIPYIPSLEGPEFDAISQGIDRNAKIKQRFEKWLLDLSNLSVNCEFPISFEIRIIANGVDIQQSPTRIFLIGKSFSIDRTQAVRYAEQLYVQMETSFPAEAPYQYPLKWLAEKETLSIFSLIHSNVSIKQIEKKIESISSSNDSAIGDFPLSFCSNGDLSGFAKVLDVLGRQTGFCILSIVIRSTKLTLEERREIARRKNFVSRQVDLVASINNPRAIEMRSQLPFFDETMRNILESSENLFLFKIQVVCDNHQIDDLIGALGVLLSFGLKPRWDVVFPSTNTEKRIAFRNFRLLEFQEWNSLSLNSKLGRLTQLAHPQEISGIFRLPVPLIGHHLSGLVVKDEPWVLPVNQIAALDRNMSISLGKIVNGNEISEVDCWMNVTDLRRHILVAGQTGAGKSTTIISLLNQLWLKKIPFLVLYPINKNDYRDMRNIGGLRNELLIFTAGSHISPLQFNPLFVPNGVLIKKFINNFRTGLMAAFEFEGSSPAHHIIEKSLVNIFQKRGWSYDKDRGSEAHEYPGFKDLCDEVPVVIQETYKDASQEIRGNLTNALDARLQRMKRELGSDLNVQKGFPFDTLLNKPVVIELASLGDDGMLKAAYVSFFLNRLRAEREVNQRQETKPHVMVIEEAHALMSASSNAKTELTKDNSERISRLLAEMGGKGEAFIIAEQIPSKLVRDAIVNTKTKIFQALPDDFEREPLFGNLKITDKQMQDLRTLPDGYAVTRAGEMAVKIRPTLIEYAKPAITSIESDIEVEHFMRQQMYRLGIEGEKYDENRTASWKDILSSEIKNKEKEKRLLGLLEQAGTKENILMRDMDFIENQSKRLLKDERNHVFEGKYVLLNSTVEMLKNGIIENGEPVPMYLGKIHDWIKSQM